MRVATNCEVENYIAMFIWCISDNLLHSISHPSPCLKTCHDILVLELTGFVVVGKGLGSIHYRFKLLIQHYLENFFW